VIVNLLHKTDGTLEIQIPGAGYAIPRQFAWYSDAASILISNYNAKFRSSYSADISTGIETVEIWESVKGEELPAKWITKGN
jgi:hypothetical protein